MIRFPLGVQLGVLVLASARLTLLVTDDRITRSWRQWIERRHGRENLVVVLSRCPWCSGWWIAIGLSGAWSRWPVGTTVVNVPFAVAMVAGGIAAWFHQDEPPLLPPVPPSAS